MLAQGPDFILMQDNTRQHAAQDAMGYMDLAGIEVMGWPAGSADLDPIENLWLSCQKCSTKSSVHCSGSHTGACGGMAGNPPKHHPRDPQTYPEHITSMWLRSLMPLTDNSGRSFKTIILIFDEWSV